MTALLVALGAAVGAPLRYLTDVVLKARFGDGFPWGTLAVNVAGSFLLGLLAGWPAPAGVTALLGTGFCGALTTWSAFGWETLALARAGARRRAAANAAAHVAAGLAAAWAGLSLGGLIGP